MPTANDATSSITITNNARAFANDNQQRIDIVGAQPIGIDDNNSSLTINTLPEQPILRSNFDIINTEGSFIGSTEALLLNFIAVNSSGNRYFLGPITFNNSSNFSFYFNNNLVGTFTWETALQFTAADFQLQDNVNFNDPRIILKNSQAGIMRGGFTAADNENYIPGFVFVLNNMRVGDFRLTLNGNSYTPSYPSRHQSGSLLRDYSIGGGTLHNNLWTTIAKGIPGGFTSGLDLDDYNDNDVIEIMHKPLGSAYVTLTNPTSPISRLGCWRVSELKSAEAIDLTGENPPAVQTNQIARSVTVSGITWNLGRSTNNTLAMSLNQAVSNSIVGAFRLQIIRYQNIV